jgi:hypothetical protein
MYYDINNCTPDSPATSATSSVSNTPILDSMTCGSLATPDTSSVSNIPVYDPRTREYVEGFNQRIREDDSAKYGNVHCPYMLTMTKYEHRKFMINNETIKKNLGKDYEHLYVCDELISGRITINGNKMEIEYFEVKPTRFVNYILSMFHLTKIETYVDINNKNMELWREACAVAKVKKLMPPFPPLTYRT